MRRLASIRTTLWRVLLAVSVGMALGGGTGGGAARDAGSSVANAAPLAQAGPALTIGTVTADPGAPIAVPIQFTANGASISTLLFSIDYDQAALTLDPADADGDGIPDALAFELPAGLMVSATLDPGDADSELDVLITGMKAPLPAVPDGTLAVMTFQPKSGASAAGPSTSIRFASAPAPSFGSTTGQSVAGTATGGSVRWTGGSSGSVGAAPTTAASGARVSTPVPAASGGATPRSSQDRGTPAPGGASASGAAGATAGAPEAAPVGALGAATAAGSAAAAGGLGDVADPLGAMPFNPAMTAMTQALGEATAAAIANPALDSTGNTSAPDTGATAATTASGTAVAALPAATGDAAAGGAASSDASDPPVAGSSSGSWLLAIVVGAALVGGWLAYRRRGGGGLHAE